MIDRKIASRPLLTALVLALAVILAPRVEAEAPAWPADWEVFKTEHSYKTLVANLNEAIAASPVAVVSRASATVGVSKVLGETIPGNMVVGAYAPNFAKRMLAASIPAGIEAPIRFYITENEDGTATLSYKAPSLVFAPYDDGGEPLDQLAAELDEIFAAIAAEATGM